MPKNHLIHLLHKKVLFMTQKMSFDFVILKKRSDHDSSGLTLVLQRKKKKGKDGAEMENVKIFVGSGAYSSSN